MQWLRKVGSPCSEMERHPNQALIHGKGRRRQRQECEHEFCCSVLERNWRKGQTGRDPNY
jgi:hypothetical protein